MTYFDELYTNNDAVMTVVAPLTGEFSRLFNLEKALFNKMRKSHLTKSIVEADRRLDADVTGMRALVMAGLHSPDESARDSAWRLHNRFIAFGNVFKQSYEEKPADVIALLADLAGEKYSEDAKALNMTSWVDDLDDAVRDFTRLMVERREEETAKPEGRLIDARRQLGKVYRQMISMVEAAATLDAKGSYDGFIDELNYEIKRYNEADREPARKDIGATDRCVVEPVETLPYTGKAVTPIVKAFYRAAGRPTVELVFARDFFLTYRHNVEAGTAVVTLHGKGGYKGRFSTTFNIAREERSPPPEGQ
jgi:hypothetical protein